MFGMEKQFRCTFKMTKSRQEACRIDIDLYTFLNNKYFPSHSGQMPIDLVMFEQRNTALTMAKCMELQGIGFKSAKYSLSSIEKCVKLQKISFTRAKCFLLHQDTIPFFTFLSYRLYFYILQLILIYVVYPLPKNWGGEKI